VVQADGIQNTGEARRAEAAGIDADERILIDGAAKIFQEVLTIEQPIAA
jgi:hypothetical protein